MDPHNEFYLDPERTAHGIEYGQQQQRLLVQKLCCGLLAFQFSRNFFHILEK